MTNADKGNIEVINGSIGDLIFRIETLTSDRDTIKVCIRAANELTAMEKKIQHLTAFNESMQTDARKNTETINKLKQALTDIRATTVMLGDSQGGWKAWRECCEIAGEALK